MTPRHAAVQAVQLHQQALAHVGGGEAGELATQQAIAQREHGVGAQVEAGRRQQRQGLGRLLQIAGVVGVLQPERDHVQRALIQFQRQAVEHAVVVAVLPAGTRHVPQVGLGQFVEGGDFGGGGILRGQHLHFAVLFGVLRFFHLKQWIEVQRAPHFHFQLQAIQLQQPDRLQQLRRQVELLPELGGKSRLHSRCPRFDGMPWSASHRVDTLRGG
jgi:hypothetical protein